MNEDPSFATEQEQFWAGRFGDDYTERNRDSASLAGNRALFQRILHSAGAVESVLELGANIGLNLSILHELVPHARLCGVEINRRACEELSKLPYVEARQESILDLSIEEPFELVFVKGVLIHIAPEQLATVYATMVEASRRYVCLVEYYNPTPVEVPYRGHTRRLFKRDFAGEILDGWDLDLLDYGFVYHRDPRHPLDDLTWFLLEKR